MDRTTLEQRLREAKTHVAPGVEHIARQAMAEGTAEATVEGMAEAPVVVAALEEVMAAAAVLAPAVRAPVVVEVP
jgi:hypothetical protein